MEIKRFGEKELIKNLKFENSQLQMQVKNLKKKNEKLKEQNQEFENES